MKQTCVLQLWESVSEQRVKRKNAFSFARTSLRFIQTLFPLGWFNNSKLSSPLRASSNASVGSEEKKKTQTLARNNNIVAAAFTLILPPRDYARIEEKFLACTTFRNCANAETLRCSRTLLRWSIAHNAQHSLTYKTYIKMDIYVSKHLSCV